MVSSISEVSSDEWDSCSRDATGSEQFNPFLSHGFLSSLEETGCAVKVRNVPFLYFYSAKHSAIQSQQTLSRTTKYIHPFHFFCTWNLDELNRYGIYLFFLFARLAYDIDKALVCSTIWIKL